MDSIKFLTLAWVTGSVLSCLGVAIQPKQFRLSGFLSWTLFFFLAGFPTLPGVLAINNGFVTADIRVPAAAGFATIFGVIWIRWVLPRIIPDFHTTSVPSSLFIGLLLGLTILGLSKLLFGAI